MPAAIQHSLRCHPNTPDTSVRAIQVSLQLTSNGGLALNYRITGNTSAIRIPPCQVASASDGLWQHTCCEFFIAAVDDENYLEFNFSPSSQWANYRFTRYRERDPAFAPAAALQITTSCTDDELLLTAVLDKKLLPATGTFNIGLTAVSEATDGSKSYWALVHCADQPDFHLRPSFTLTLNTTNP